MWWKQSPRPGGPALVFLVRDARTDTRVLEVRSVSLESSPVSVLAFADVSSLGFPFPPVGDLVWEPGSTGSILRGLLRYPVRFGCSPGSTGPLGDLSIRWQLFSPSTAPSLESLEERLTGLSPAVRECFDVLVADGMMDRTLDELVELARMLVSHS